MWKSYQKIANRQTFEGLCNMEKIAEEADIEKKVRRYLSFFRALQHDWIWSYGVLSCLGKNKDELERKIEEYIMCLRSNPSLLNCSVKKI